MGMLEKIHEITEHHSERLVLKQLFTSYVVFVKRGGNTICSCYFHFHLRVMVRNDSSCLFAVKFTCLQRLKSGCIVGIVGSSVYVILTDTLD